MDRKSKSMLDGGRGKGLRKRGILQGRQVGGVCVYGDGET